MDPQQLTDLILQKKWVALMALLIGLVVRLLKSDTKIPIDIPPQYRVWLALGLAPIAGAIDKVAAGNSWTQAMVEGAIAAVLAIVGHNAVVDSLRGGKEFNVPGLIKTDTPPGPGKPPTLRPPPIEVEGGKKFIDLTPKRFSLARIVLPLAASFLIACGIFTPARDVQIAKGSCIIANAFLDSDALNTICNLLTPEEIAMGKALSEAHRAKVAEQMKAIRAERCAPTSARADVDGGAK